MKNKQRFLGHHRLMLLEARKYLRSYYDLSLIFHANHRASECALVTRRMAMALSDELQESVE